MTEQVRGLLERGVEVDVWSDVGDTSGPPLEHPQLQHHVWPSPGLGAYLALARLGLGAALEAMKAAKQLPFAQASRFAARIGALRGSPRYDLVVAHFGPAGLEAQLYRDQGVLKGPLAVFLHGSDLSSVPQRHGPDVYRRLLAEAEWVLPESERGRRRLFAMGGRLERTFVHRTGVDLAHVPFAPRWWSPEEGLKLVSVGPLTEQRGLQTAIPAVAALARQFPGVSWDIVGEGPLGPELERMAEKHGAPARFLGARPPSEVARIRAGAHLLLAPSQTAANGEQDGIPLEVMEAMAHGRMVVSTYHAGIPELVRNGVTGYLAEPGDAGALLRTLVSACARFEEWPGQLAAARRRVEAEFDRAVWDARLHERVTASS